MDYTHHIQKAIDFIEENLKFDISFGMCARGAGYSEYHFLRIFKEATSETPSSYIRKRRLTDAAKDINKTNKPIYEVALEWGFNSSENFTRAFKTEHNVTPVQYRNLSNSLHLYEKLDLLMNERSRDNLDINFEIVEIQSFKLYGYILNTTREKSGYEVPRFWNEYNCSKKGEKLQPDIHQNNRKDYGVSIQGINKGEFDYFIGVKSVKPIYGVKCLTIPSGLYAVFKTPVADNFTFVETIHLTWSYIYNDWPLNSQYERLDGLEFETYCEASNKYSEKIYIPIRKREGIK